MKHPRLAISAMAVVHLLLFILLLVCGEPRPLWLAYCRLAIFSSQGYLLGLWAALGGKPTPWRATLVVIVAATWGWFMGPITFTPIGIVTAVMAEQTFQVMGILLLARFLGLGLEKAHEDCMGHLQFSAGQALQWMTALAVFMGATHYLKDSFAIYFTKQRACLPASWLAVSLATMWLICGSRWVALRCFTLLATIGLAATWIERAAVMPWSDGAYLLACEAAVTAASLAVVRLAGYRLVRHWPFRRSRS